MIRKIPAKPRSVFSEFGLILQKHFADESQSMLSSLMAKEDRRENILKSVIAIEYIFAIIYLAGIKNK